MNAIHLIKQSLIHKTAVCGPPINTRQMYSIFRQSSRDYYYSNQYFFINLTAYFMNNNLINLTNNSIGCNREYIKLFNEFQFTINIKRIACYLLR